MHELAVTEGILNVALESANQNNARRITRIDLVVGEISSIVDDSVQFYFDMLSKDTIAAGATLNFRREPATAACLTCGHSYTARAPLNPLCPECNSSKIRITGGREFYVESIEVD